MRSAPFAAAADFEPPRYEIGRTLSGDAAEIAAAYRRFEKVPVDEAFVEPSCSSPFPVERQGLLGEAPVAGVGTFEGGEKQTIVFAPSSRPGWWIRREDLPEQLDTEVDIANLWTSARNLVLRSGSPHNYLRMVEHIIALKAGLGLDDALLKVRSGDPPLFDQSSLPLVKAVEHAKVTRIAGTRARYFTVSEPLAFGGSRGDFLLFLPAAPGETRLRIDCAISWNTVIGDQRIVFDVTPATFRRAALARTNATHRQYLLAKTVGKLFAATRNWGYNKRNILIHGRKFYTEPRFPCGGKFLEPVWHRATLDLLAAIALAGDFRFVGTVVSWRAGHTLDCDAVRALRRNGLLTEVAPAPQLQPSQAQAVPAPAQA